VVLPGTTTTIVDVCADTLVGVVGVVAPPVLLVMVEFGNRTPDVVLGLEIDVDRERLVEVWSIERLEGSREEVETEETGAIVVEEFRADAGGQRSTRLHIKIAARTRPDLSIIKVDVVAAIFGAVRY